ncbi:hypothetical protein FVB9288_01796 [Flavobacterium sp. CECT 9288]|uniref:hypothetical protein n=1 Tax=Flavobacterium sp. CECT 9288 TaxID=2845819 RepID=UPI001E43F5F0|nr:hypothetical protein [Flavobacterium sp. CECT 9288]CAH0336122.1 hypothetical protein FVB9288_01796 [Flavobacterium sp. CECT 9288]
MKYLHILDVDGKRYGGSDLETAFNHYSNLNISPELKKSLKLRIFSENNFEISTNEMSEIVLASEYRIDELLKHPDFNPFKKELREQFPEQFENQPFKYKGVTYYLYHKGREYEIDKFIYNLTGFKKLLEEHIKANQPLKYFYKK